ncbi:hypothetical protein BDR04DRAFT_957973, partial [Suillus decipiens]
HTSDIYAIAISSKGRILTSVSNNDTGRIWDLDHDHPISSPSYHAAPVNGVSFSADGKLLATGCFD